MQQKYAARCHQGQWSCNRCWASADRHRGCHHKGWVTHRAHHLRQVGQECRELAGLLLLLRGHTQLEAGGCCLSPLLLVHMASLQWNRLVRQHQVGADSLCNLVVQTCPTACRTISSLAHVEMAKAEGITGLRQLAWKPSGTPRLWPCPPPPPGCPETTACCAPPAGMLDRMSGAPGCSPYCCEIRGGGRTRCGSCCWGRCFRAPCCAGIAVLDSTSGGAPCRCCWRCCSSSCCWR